MRYYISYKYKIEQEPKRIETICLFNVTLPNLIKQHSSYLRYDGQREVPFGHAVHLEFPTLKEALEFGQKANELLDKYSPEHEIWIQDKQEGKSFTVQQGLDNIPKGTGKRERFQLQD